MDEIIKLRGEEISTQLRLGSAYRFLDAVDVLVGKASWGVRYFPEDEWFFKHHFLTDPVVPGVFQLEHIMQAAAVAVLLQKIPDTNIIYGKNFTDVNFISFVRPGETLHCDTKIKYFKRGLGAAEGFAWVMRNGEKVITSTAKFQMVSPTLLNKYIPKAVNNV